jgi:hypothetical protein
MLFDRGIDLRSNHVDGILSLCGPMDVSVPPGELKSIFWVN